MYASVVQGTAHSAIADGTIIVGGEDRSNDASINRDTAGANDGALTQDFTDDLRDEIADGFAAAQIPMPSKLIKSGQRTQAERPDF